MRKKCLNLVYLITILLNCNLFAMEELESEAMKDVKPQILNYNISIVKDYLKDHFTYPTLLNFPVNFFIDVLKFSPKNDYLAFGGSNGNIQLWDLNKNQEKRAFVTKEDGIVYSIAISPDGKLLFSGSSSGLDVWDINLGKKKQTLSKDVGFSVVISPKNNLLIFNEGHKPAIKIVDLNTGQEKQTLYGHEKEILSLGLSPNENLLVSDSRDGTFKIWDLTTGKEKFTLSKPSKFKHSFAISPDNRLFVGWMNGLKIWDLNTGKEKPFGHNLDEIQSIAVSPNDNLLLLGISGVGTEIWDYNTNKKLRTIHAPMVRIETNLDGSLVAIYSPNEIAVKLMPQAVNKYLYDLQKTYKTNSVKTAQMGLLMRIAGTIEENKNKKLGEIKKLILEKKWEQVAYNNFPTFIKEALKDIIKK